MLTTIIALAVLQWTEAVTPPAAQHVPPSVPPPVAVAMSSRAAATLAQDEQEVVYTDNYYTRLDVHRALSYALIPLFVLQYSAGRELYDQGSGAPLWARFGHRVGATGIAAIFAANVVTGLPNLVAGRKDPADRGRRFTHATLMLTATAGFVATGLLAERAEGSPDDRAMHRTIALGSVGLATLGYLMMLDVFRKD